MLLIGAAILSSILGGRTDAIIIGIIVVLSGLLGFFQERGAVNSLEKLLQLVAVRAMVLRDGKEVEIPLEEVVPGDLLILNAGDLVPADCTLVEANHLFVNEATLTGESGPIEKESQNPVYMGTTIASGVAKAVVTATGRTSKYGNIIERTRFKPPQTAFELGVSKFGYFLLLVTLILTGAIFIFNVVLHRPILDSFLFALALAVGLTPQLLPAIISVNLSHGARKMAQKKVVIKRLASIENFGQMDVLCTDKTGTITLGKIELDRAVNIRGEPSDKVGLYGFLNAHFQTAYTNPLDQAILDHGNFDAGEWKRIGEIPYDFSRKRLSVLFEGFLICKGAVPQILSVCDRVEMPDGSVVSLEEQRAEIERYFIEQSEQGFRLLAVAYGQGSEENHLILAGFLFFLDPIKPDIAQTVEKLKTKGIQLKIITGDNRFIAAHIAKAVGFPDAHLITGDQLGEDLHKVVKEKNVFAEIEPHQKELIVLALRKAGHIVGYLGDGVNDVAALHSADVGIAVDSGADAAKEASDIVLLEKELSVLKDGVVEGRTTFVNTLKYVYMATSANFGNMFSMAGASLFLPFLPLLPKQILLTNLLTDFPEMAIASDSVDPERVVRPVKWNLPFIRHFMIIFGLISSVFDYATFFVLLYLLHADERLFQTGWFVESVVSATSIVLAIRTRGPLIHSKPGKLLLFAVLATIALVLFFPYTPLASLFGFVPLPLFFYATLAGIIALYILSVEIAKRFVFHRH